MLTLLVVLAAPGGARGEKNLELAELGGRARAMGGAYTAVAEDLSAVFWNPAGLAGFERPTLQADIRLLFGSGSLAHPVPAFESPAGTVPVSDFSVAPGSDLTYYLLGAASRLPWPALRSLGLTGGVSFRRVIDFLYTQDQVLEFDAGGGTFVPLEFKDEGTGGVDAFTFTLAGDVASRVQWGVNLNVLDGRLATLDEQSVVFSGIPVFLDARSSAQQMSGFSAELGVKAHLHRMLDVGAVLRPAYDVDFTDGEFHGVAFVTAGAPGLEPVDVDVTLPIPDQRLELPTFYAFGVALRPHPKLLLAADYQRRPWDEARVMVDDGSGRFVDSEQRFYATHALSIGGEYYAEAGGVGVPIRGGFHTAPTVRANTDTLSADVGSDGFRTFRGDRVEGHTISLGIGLYFRTVHFDVGFDRTSFSTTDFLLEDQPLPGQPVRVVEIDRTKNAMYFSSTVYY